MLTLTPPSIGGYFPRIMMRTADPQSSCKTFATASGDSRVQTSFGTRLSGSRDAAAACRAPRRHAGAGLHRGRPQVSWRLFAEGRDVIEDEAGIIVLPLIRAGPIARVIVREVVDEPTGGGLTELLVQQCKHEERVPELVDRPAHSVRRTGVVDDQRKVALELALMFFGLLQVEVLVPGVTLQHGAQVEVCHLLDCAVASFGHVNSLRELERLTVA